jgi:hypothetical protein
VTTHETQPETADPTHRGDRVETAEPMTEPPQAETLAAPQAADAPVESGAPTRNLDASEGTDQMLFADGELSGLRSRWNDVQAAFVDDPRDCVQKADGLVADVVDKLTAGFAQARSRLEEQWDRGEEVSTEDLRIALKRYREFFERLLAV